MAWSWGAEVKPKATHLEPIPWGRIIIPMILILIVATAR